MTTKRPKSTGPLWMGAFVHKPDGSDFGVVSPAALAACIDDVRTIADHAWAVLLLDDHARVSLESCDAGPDAVVRAARSVRVVVDALLVVRPTLPERVRLALDRVARAVGVDP